MEIVLHSDLSLRDRESIIKPLREKNQLLIILEVGKRDCWSGYGQLIGATGRFIEILPEGTMYSYLIKLDKPMKVQIGDSECQQTDFYFSDVTLGIVTEIDLTGENKYSKKLKKFNSLKKGELHITAEQKNPEASAKMTFNSPPSNSENIFPKDDLTMSFCLALKACNDKPVDHREELINKISSQPLTNEELDKALHDITFGGDQSKVSFIDDKGLSELQKTFEKPMVWSGKEIDGKFISYEDLTEEQKKEFDETFNNPKEGQERTISCGFDSTQQKFINGKWVDIKVTTAKECISEMRNNLVEYLSKDKGVDHSKIKVTPKVDPDFYDSWSTIKKNSEIEGNTFYDPILKKKQKFRDGQWNDFAFTFEGHDYYLGDKAFIFEMNVMEPAIQTITSTNIKIAEEFSTFSKIYPTEEFRDKAIENFEKGESNE